MLKIVKTENKTESTLHKLDESYKKDLLAMREILKKLKKHDKIRIEKWIEKLSQIGNNVSYKKNRNKHIHCLLYMCKM